MANDSKRFRGHVSWNGGQGLWIVEADFRIMHDIPPYCWLWKIASQIHGSHNQRLAWKIFDIFTLVSQVLCLGHTWICFWNGENTWLSCLPGALGCGPIFQGWSPGVKFEFDSPNWWNFFKYVLAKENPKKYGVFWGTGQDMRFSCWIWIIHFNLWSKMGFVHHVCGMRTKCRLSVASTSSDQLVN